MFLRFSPSLSLSLSTFSFSSLFAWTLSMQICSNTVTDVPSVNRLSHGANGCAAPGNISSRARAHERANASCYQFRRIEHNGKIKWARRNRTSQKWRHRTTRFIVETELHTRHFSLFVYIYVYICSCRYVTIRSSYRYFFSNKEPRGICVIFCERGSISAEEIVYL